MADLGTLALGTYANVASTAIQGSDPVLEVIASTDDADYAYDATNTTHTGSCYFALGDVPADFASMLTVSIRLRYAWAAGTQGNTWDTLRARIYASDGTTALTDLLTVVSTITTTSITNSSVTAFAGVVASDKTTWNGARVYLYWYITKVKGGDTLRKNVYAAEVTGTYTAASPDLNVNAELASGATTAYDANDTKIDPNVGVASGATTAYDAADTKIDPNAGLASGATTAYDAGDKSDDPAGVSSGATSAYDAGPKLEITAGVAG